MKHFFTLLLIFSAIQIFPQIVNVEKKRNISGKAFQATFDFSTDIKDLGNKILKLDNDIDLQYKKSASTYIFINSMSYMLVDNQSIINKGYQHLRYNYTVKDSSFLTFEIFGQHQYTEHKLLAKRMLAGGGTRIRIINSKKKLLYFAPLIMYEYEKLTDSLKSQVELMRLDAYLSTNYEINKYLSFNNVTYFQPAFKNFSDYRISSETSLRIKISNHFSFDTSFSVDFDSMPPPEVQNMFYIYANKLTFIL